MPLTMERPMETETAVKLDKLKIVDERTGQSYEVPIENGTIRGTDLKKIRSGPDDPGLMVYDPAYMNTAACRSAITFIDGDKGILRYRGYPIEQLAEHCSFLEVAYLLLHGELPNKARDRGVDPPDHVPHDDPREHQEVHGRLRVRRPPDGHPRRDRRGALHLLSRCPQHPRRGVPAHADRTASSAKMPTLAAFAYRHSRGLPYAYPDNDLRLHGKLPRTCSSR